LICDEGSRVTSGDLIAKLSPDGLDSEERAQVAALDRERRKLKALRSGNREREILLNAAPTRYNAT
jgi:multidrug efflux pump subunit AcrA (membrane-fusion protein)